MRCRKKLYEQLSVRNKELPPAFPGGLSCSPDSPSHSTAKAPAPSRLVGSSMPASVSQKRSRTDSDTAAPALCSAVPAAEAGHPVSALSAARGEVARSARAACWASGAATLRASAREAAMVKDASLLGAEVPASLVTRTR